MPKMDLGNLAELALTAKTSLGRQNLSLAMVKQQLNTDKAAVQLVSQATAQVQKAAAAASAGGRGQIIDIVV
jgi:hypothetical protein